MTFPTPSVQGKPDWLPQLQSSNLLVFSKSESIAAQTIYPAVYAGSTGFIYIRLQSSVLARLTVDWYTDSTLATRMFTDVITNVVPGIGIAEVIIPARGAWVRFTVDQASYPNTHTTVVFAVTGRGNRYALNDGENMLITNFNTALAGGANVVVPAGVVRQGRAEWTCDLLGATTFVAYLRSVRFNGTADIIDYISNVNRAQRRSVYLPALPISVQIFNQDVGAHDFNVAVNYHAFDY
jgi:hypothetical protein